MEYQTTLPVSWETSMQVKKQQLESSVEQMTGIKLGKQLWRGCMLSLCLFNLQAEYIMQNARLDESQAGVKIAERNINNLRNVDDITLMTENEEQLRSFLIKVKEESERAGLQLKF